MTTSWCQRDAKERADAERGMARVLLTYHAERFRVPERAFLAEVLKGRTPLTPEKRPLLDQMWQRARTSMAVDITAGLSRPTCPLLEARVMTAMTAHDIRDLEFILRLASKGATADGKGPLAAGLKADADRLRDVGYQQQLVEQHRMRCNA